MGHHQPTNKWEEEILEFGAHLNAIFNLQPWATNEVTRTTKFLTDLAFSLTAQLKTKVKSYEERVRPLKLSLVTFTPLLPPTTRSNGPIHCLDDRDRWQDLLTQCQTDFTHCVHMLIQFDNLVTHARATILPFRERGMVSELDFKFFDVFIEQLNTVSLNLALNAIVPKGKPPSIIVQGNEFKLSVQFLAGLSRLMDHLKSSFLSVNAWLVNQEEINKIFQAPSCRAMGKMYWTTLVDMSENRMCLQQFAPCTPPPVGRGSRSGRKRKATQMGMKPPQASPLTVPDTLASTSNLVPAIFEFRDLIIELPNKVSHHDGGEHVSTDMYCVLYFADCVVKGTSYRAWAFSSPFLFLTNESHQMVKPKEVMFWFDNFHITDPTLLSSLTPHAVHGSVGWSHFIQQLGKFFKAETKTRRNFSPLNEQMIHKMIMANGDDSNVVTRDQLSRPVGVNKEDGTTFSFWDWFYAIIKMFKGTKRRDEHMRKLWDAWLIMGFVDGTTSDTLMLSQKHEVGTLVVRFSDKAEGTISVSLVVDTQPEILNSRFNKKDLKAKHIVDRLLFDLSFQKVYCEEKVGGKWGFKTETKKVIYNLLDILDINPLTNIPKTSTPPPETRPGTIYPYVSPIAMSHT